MNYRDLDVKDLEASGLLVPFEKFDTGTGESVKCLIMDAALGLVTGVNSIPADELDKLRAHTGAEPRLCRPVWPPDVMTGMEMSGFLNSYCLRYPDMTDTLRLPRSTHGAGGHPSDQMAAMFTLCDFPGVTGKKIMECVHLGYQMWSILLNHMLTDRNLDCSTALSLTTPVLAAVCMGDEPERIQNALNLSVAEGVVLGRVRSTDDMTNLKSAAAGMTISHALHCYRMSDVIEAPATIFTGDRGSWSIVVGPLEGEWKGMSQDEVYECVEIKSTPCFNVAQAPVECAISIHKALGGELSRIRKITLRKSAVEAKIPFRPDRPKYPHDHPTADHHMEYCVAAGLRFGMLTPAHYSDECISDELVRHFIDITELKVFTEAELAELGGNIGACSLVVELDDGTCITEVRRRAAGVMMGLKGAERAGKMREIVEAKREMVEKCYGYDLSGVADVIYDLENRPARDVVDALQAVLRSKE